MRLTLDKQCILSGADPGITHQIKQALTMNNPAYIEAKKRNRWTGNIDKILYFYEETEHGDLLFPRGFIRQALELMGANRPSLILQDNRCAYNEIDFEFIGKLRPYQDQAFNMITPVHFGVLEALMGSGKTVVALAVIAARKQPTLILVHNKELLYQWRDRIAEFLGISAGLIGDGQYDIRSVTVAIINSAKKHLEWLPPYFGQIIIDECHRTPATMFSEVVRAFDCKYMLGLSATPYRRDGLTNLIHWFVGSLVHRIDPEELKEVGAVLVPHIHTRETGFNYAKLLSLIVVDEDRNNQIIYDILVEVRKRTGTALVVSDRVEHCETLTDLLRSASGTALRVEMLTGQIKAQERTSLVEDIRAGRVDVVVATVQLIGEGFDCPRLYSLFLATPIKFSARLIQVVGRILRPEDGKKPRVYDYHDPVGPLFASAKSREKTYREMGWINEIA
jgi:superfamily II DNA or RNA helicase